MNVLRGIEHIQNKFVANTELQNWRALAKERFEKTGLPTRKNESWRYTNLLAISETFWQPTESHAFFDVTKLESGYDHIVFVNGVFKADFSSEFANDVQIKKLSELSAEELLFWKMQSSGTEGMPLVDLNTAWLCEGISIEVKHESDVKKPICIHHFFSGEGAKKISAQPRIFVKIKNRSRVTLLFKTYGEATCLQNLVTTILQEANSSLDFVELINLGTESFGFSSTEILLNSGAQLHSTSVSLNAKLSRQTLQVRHLQPNSASSVFGAYICEKNQQSDHYTNIEHLVGHCQSRQLYKGILTDQSKAVFNGRVFIDRGANKASSEQLNKNLLLSSQAEIDAKPQLEILADDVKATHGATVGQLNEEEIFYLCSRAIPREKAIQFLSEGFVLEVLENIQNKKIHDFIAKSVQEKLKNMEPA